MAKKKKKLFGKFDKTDNSIIDVEDAPAAEEVIETGEQAAEELGNEAEQVMENIEETTEQVADGMENSMEETVETFDNAEQSFNDEVTYFSEQNNAAAEDFTETINETAENVEEAVNETADDFGETVEETAESIEENAENVGEEVSNELSDTIVATTIADPGDDVTEVSTFDTTNIGKQEKMAKKKKTKAKKVKVKKDRLGFNWFFWLSFIIIMVPVCYFLYLIYSAYQETHTPIVGDRINSEIETVIQENQLASISSRIQGLEGVEKVDMSLIVETLRIEIDVNDDLSGDDITDILTQSYDVVNEVLPVESYFTQHNDYKEYDLEIYAYDNLELDDFRIVLLNRNSKMEGYLLQSLTTPVNSSVAEELQELREEQRYKRDHPEEAEEEETTDESEAVEPNENNIAVDDVEG